MVMHEAVLGADVGDEQKEEDPTTLVLCERSCHLINFETGGPAALSGVMISPTDGAHGIFKADQVRAAIRPSSRRMPGLATHMHGARLLNAVVKSGVPAIVQRGRDMRDNIPVDLTNAVSRSYL